MRRAALPLALAFALQPAPAGLAAAAQPVPAAVEPLPGYLHEPPRAAVADRGVGFLGPIFVAVQGVGSQGAFTLRIERFVPPVAVGGRIGLARPLGNFPDTALDLPSRDSSLRPRLELAELEGPDLVLLRLVVANGGSEPVRLTRVTPLGVDPTHGGVWTSGLQQENAVVLGEAPDLGMPGRSTLTLATEPSRASWYQLIYEHSTGRSTLAGLLSLDHALSELIYEPDPAGRGIAAFQVDLMLRPHVLLEPGAEYRTETLYIDRSRLDPIAKLTRYLRSMAAYQQILPPPDQAVAGWNPWPLHSFELDDAAFDRNLAQLAALFGPFGLARCQIGPGWAEQAGEWTPAARFPGGLARLVERIRDRGLEACLWWSPFSGSRAVPLATAHPEWMLELDTLGRGLWDPQTQYVLDPGNRDALDWVRAEQTRLASAGVTCFVESDLERVLFGQRSGPVARTAVQLLRDALAELHAAGVGAVTSTGSGAVGFLAGRATCVHGGPALLSRWHVPAPAPGETEAPRGGLREVGAWSVPQAAGALARRLAMDGILWRNHAGTVAVAGLSREEARAILTALALSGASFDLGDLPETLDVDMAEIVRRALPPLGRPAQPLDMLLHDPPWIWHLPIRCPAGDWELVAFFNWGVAPDGSTPDDRPRRLGVTLPALGLPVGESYTYHAFELWSETYLGTLAERVEMDVPARAVRLVKIVRTVPRPDFLASSRHWTMGALDVARLAWNQDSEILFGRQQLIAGARLRLFLTLPERWRVRRFHLNGVDQKWRQENGLVELDLVPAASGSQFWELVASSQ